MRRSLAAIGFTLLITAVAPSSAPAAVFPKGITADATTVYFDSDERLVAADADSLQDTYQRSGGVTTLVSVPGAGASGPSGGASFAGATPDGTKVYFHTTENLVAADTDGFQDVYQRSGGVTTLISAPGAGATGAGQSAGFKRVTADGSKVFFATAEQLVAQDTDVALEDTYERSAGTTTLVSVTGVGSTPPVKSVTFVGASADGSRVFLLTEENFIAADTDGLFDLYERSGGTTSLVSAPGAGATPPAKIASGLKASTDGTRLFFTTDENMVAADTDGLRDVYERSGGTTTLISEQGAGASGSPANANHEGVSDDGTRVFFETSENMVAADTDGLNDVYQRSGGVTTLISVPGVGATGPPTNSFFLDSNGDGSVVLFDTDENMVTDDTDGFFDTYRRSGGTTTLVSVVGPGASGPANDANFESASDDALTVFFQSDQNLLAADFDGLQDVYEASGGTIALASAPGAGATGPADEMDFGFNSADGSRLIFRTVERLTGDDGDTITDIYERTGGVTTLLSGEPGPPLGSPPETTLTSDPGATTTDTTPSFSFSSSESPSTFECSVDAASFTACTSPFTTQALALGAHNFSVRAIDFALNVDATPAAFPFTVTGPEQAAPPAVPPKKCKKGQKLKKGKCVKKKRKKK